MAITNSITTFTSPRNLALLALSALLVVFSAMPAAADDKSTKDAESEKTPTIAERFETLRQQNAAKAPPAVLAVGARQRQAILDAGMLESAVQVGDKMPSFALPNPVGEIISSKELLAEGPLVVVFYRGGWCPFCNLQLIGY